MKSAKIVWLILAAGLIGAAAYLWHACFRSDEIAFLPADARAGWIVYPRPPDTSPRRNISFTAEFRRSFRLDHVPPNAVLRARAFRSAEIFINGQPGPKLESSGWKKVRDFDVTNLIHPGTNELTVMVTNAVGPPALWLVLDAGAETVRSDSSWIVSLARASWQPAILAHLPPMIRPGSFIFGREEMGPSLARIWWELLLIAGISISAAIGLPRLEGRFSAGGWRRAGGWTFALLLGLGVLWGFLFTNNLPKIPGLLGFDRDGHLQYIDFLLTHKRLPLADDGWQMYQPPLYYLLSALGVAPFGVTASVDGSVLALRVVSVVVGLVHLWLVLLCLRLLFPDRPASQAVGLLVAGLLPAHLCLSHHVTNEGLSALFATGSVYAALKFIHRSKSSWLWPAIAGGFLGLAMLTKFSALLAVPVVCAGVVWSACRRRESSTPAKLEPSLPGQQAGPANWASALTTLVALVLPLLLICGWHFFRVWRHFGNPLIGNWDPRLAFAWWQDPGYHTAGWFLGAGHAFATPSFSSLRSLADGIYTTLWGDGLISGGARLGYRPPWNYDLMNAGYLIALFPAILLAVGFVIALVQFLKRPGPEGVLILGLPAAFAAGIVLMTLKVPSYAQVKAFYGLPALLPVSVLVAFGWQFLADRWTALRGVGLTLLVAWAVTAYASFWIRPGNPARFAVQGVGLADDKRYQEAVGAFQRALELDPHSLAARAPLTDVLTLMGQSDEAAKVAAQSLADHPDAPEALMQQGLVIARSGRYEESLPFLTQAAQKLPDDPNINLPLATCFVRAGKPAEALAACREGLRANPFNPELRHRLASSLAALGDFGGAADQLRLALDLKPNWPEAEGLLAFALSNNGQVSDALPHYERALLGKPGDARLHYLYALALSTQARSAEAVGHYQESLKIAPESAEALNNLAWLLATSPRAELRNGAEAINLAEHACALTQRQEPMFLGTLAAAYAEAGRFPDAVATAEATVKLAQIRGQKELADHNAKLLEQYRAGKPARDEAMK